MKVPPATICAQSASFSSCEPSTQWMRSGWQSSAMVLTQFNRWLLLVRGAADNFFFMVK